MYSFGMNRTGALVIAAVLSACGLFKGSSTLADQAKAAQESEGTEKPWVGALDGNFTAVDGRERASSTEERAVFYTGHSDDGKMCVVVKQDGQIMFAAASDEAYADKNHLEEVANWRLAFEMRDSLELPAKAPWPPEPKAEDQTVRMVKHETKREKHTTADGEHWYTFNRHTEIEICGSSATPRRTSKYLTLTRFKHGETPAFFAWRLDPSSVTDAPADGAEATAPASAPEASPSATKPAPAGTSTVPIALAADGRFSYYVKMLELTGYDTKLAEPGPFTLFAETDKAVDRTVGRAKVLAFLVPANKKAIELLLRGRTIEGLHPPADLREKDARFSAMYSLVQIDSKGGHLYLEKSEIRFPELNASNGVIYPLE